MKIATTMKEFLNEQEILATKMLIKFLHEGVVDTSVFVYTFSVYPEIPYREFS
jgi:hypothetical protein